ncbi:LPS assembly protein LptD [Pseudooceanicola sp.]|uniref:LPS-assembly protein LptD n=1 Tax=Pseudooceanicola sp. TaxID=1914328 RepID=UPI0026125DE7|nr:LPS assembly protein LptD [Pseudooceanicola sp.]MDF1854161.1 LPS assembly protein LptD [Pseudooceanicola sp.]
MRRSLLLRPILLCWALLLGGTAAALAQASDTAMLAADKVYLDGRDRVIAEGRVEALKDGNRLQASRIVYDRNTERLAISGPITLTEASGRVVLLADSADLDADLRSGLIRGARMMLDQQVQLAAYQMNRLDPRYAQLYKATVTSCHVCGDGRPPLWQIRARRVVHDRDERQLYFDDARFEVMGVPVFWMPRLRLPDPTLKRATGFLIPSIKRSSLLGTGLRWPYFIRIGDHRDLTLTPYVSDETRTLEFRYRQAYRNGRVTVTGAISYDDLLPNTFRGYLEVQGAFDLPQDFKLAFDIEATVDDAYPTEYDYSDKDRLDSEISVTRVRRDEYIRGALTHYHSMRVTESDANIPSLIGNVAYERRYFPSFLGGEIRMGAEAHSHYRYSDRPTDGPDADSIVDGRDVSRINADIAWLNQWTLPLGLRLGAEVGSAFDSFHTRQSTGLPASASAIAPRLGVTLRLPLRKVSANGVIHVIEPVAQVAWTGGNDLSVANDESTRVEFDEGNLLSLSRFPSPDRRERGLRGAVGFNWTRLAPSGWQSQLTIGQVIRATSDNDFHLSSGLSGRSSDLLIAGQLRAPAGLSLTARGIFRDRRDLTKVEARAAWITPKVAVGASYLWLDDDPAEDRLNLLSEWALDGTVQLAQNWLGSANWRYDLATRSTAEAGFGVTYTNECVEMEFSASRRFTSSTIVTPSTEFSFTVGLRGFSGNANGQRFARTCK